MRWMIAPWSMALDACAQEIARATPPAAIANRPQITAQKLASLKSRVASGAPLSPMRDEVHALSRELTRLAADWAGALPAK